MTNNPLVDALILIELVEAGLTIHGKQAKANIRRQPEYVEKEREKEGGREGRR